jgi:hypothetical protein
MSIAFEELLARVDTAQALSRALVAKAVISAQRSSQLVAQSRDILLRLRRRISGGADDQLDEGTVRQRVRALLDAGILPGIRTGEIRGGSREELGGCGICSAGIGIGDLSFAVPQLVGAAVIVHGRCFSIWTQEAAERAGEP